MEWEPGRCEGNNLGPEERAKLSPDKEVTDLKLQHTIPSTLAF